MRFSDAILRITDGGARPIIDMIGPGSGWKLREWRPQIAQLKGGGTKVNPAMADGQALVHAQYDNVVETFSLSAYGFDQDATIATARELFELTRQSINYWKEIWEYDPVWLEARPPCNNALIGYARIVQMQLAELGDPFGQPFYSNLWHEAVFEDLTLVVEREPFWRGVQPGTVIGPLFNYIRNPDFELWTQAAGIVDSEPDNWVDFETLWITGTNNRQDTGVNSGNHALRIRVGGSTQAGAAKGVTQTIEDLEDQTQYTVLAWVRSDGVDNGVGRILITYASQLELYRSGAAHGWTLYVATFTTGTADVVGISCEILTTDANTDGTIYIDSMMLIQGNHVTDAQNGTLPYLSGSHIVNHWDQPPSAEVQAGDINFVDVWDVPGDVDALVRLELMNNTPPTDVTDPTEIYATARIGQRRTQDVLNFDNYHDPPGISDVTASSDDRIASQALGSAWQNVTAQIIADDVRDNEGRFRLFARIKDPIASGAPTLQARARYFLGVAGINEKILDTISVLVSRTWTLIDLTPNASMIMDTKFETDPPSQLGYTIQMKRDVGTDVGHLDYVLTMPTDGGWLSAEISPELTYGNTLIVDNTNSRTLSATLRRGGFRDVYQTNAVPRCLKAYKNRLYIGCDDGELYAFQNNEGTQVGDYGISDVLYPLDEIFALEVYDAVLYIGHGDDLLSSDGEGFPYSILTTFPDEITDMRTFDARLFFAIGGVSGTVYEYDGDVWTLSYTTGEDAAEVLEVYNNRLYVGTSAAATVHEYDPATDAWALSYTAPAADATGIYSLKTFRGRLYAGSGPNGRVYSYDGDAWAEVEDFEDIDTVLALESLDGILYAGGTPAAALQASADGETWAAIYDPETFTAEDIAVYDGALFVIDQATNDLSVITFTDVQYKIPDYTGSFFTSPPSTRHRWVFSYDRPNLVNDIDDKALVGFSFVPRYFSLIGSG